MDPNRTAHAGSWASAPPAAGPSSSSSPGSFPFSSASGQPGFAFDACELEEAKVFGRQQQQQPSPGASGFGQQQQGQQDHHAGAPFSPLGPSYQPHHAPFDALYHPAHAQQPLYAQERSPLPLSFEYNAPLPPGAHINLYPPAAFAHSPAPAPASHAEFHPQPASESAAFPPSLDPRLAHTHPHALLVPADDHHQLALMPTFANRHHAHAPQHAQRRPGDESSGQEPYTDTSDDAASSSSSSAGSPYPHASQQQPPPQQQQQYQQQQQPLSQEERERRHAAAAYYERERARKQAEERDRERHRERATSHASRTYYPAYDAQNNRVGIEPLDARPGPPPDRPYYRERVRNYPGQDFGTHDYSFQRTAPPPPRESIMYPTSSHGGATTGRLQPARYTPPPPPGPPLDAPMPDAYPPDPLRLPQAPAPPPPTLDFSQQQPPPSHANWQRYVDPDPRLRPASPESAHSRQMREVLALSADMPTTLADLHDPPDGARPQYSLPNLAALAINGSEKKMLTLQGIYEAIQARFKWYEEHKNDKKGWKGSIRHNLSLNKIFRKIPRPITEPGQGKYWTLDFSQGAGNKRERRRGKGKRKQQQEQEGQEQGQEKQNTRRTRKSKRRAADDEDEDDSDAMDTDDSDDSESAAEEADKTAARARARRERERQTSLTEEDLEAIADRASMSASPAPSPATSIDMQIDPALRGDEGHVVGDASAPRRPRPRPISRASPRPAPYPTPMRLPTGAPVGMPNMAMGMHPAAYPPPPPPPHGAFGGPSHSRSPSGEASDEQQQQHVNFQGQSSGQPGKAPQPYREHQIKLGRLGANAPAAPHPQGQAPPTFGATGFGQPSGPGFGRFSSHPPGAFGSQPQQQAQGMMGGNGNHNNPNPNQGQHYRTAPQVPAQFQAPQGMVPQAAYVPAHQQQQQQQQQQSQQGMPVYGRVRPDVEIVRHGGLPMAIPRQQMQQPNPFGVGSPAGSGGSGSGSSSSTPTRTS